MEPSDKNRSGVGDPEPEERKQSLPFHIKSRISRQEVQDSKRKTWHMIRKQTLEKEQHKEVIRRRILWSSSIAAVLLAFFVMNSDRILPEIQPEWKSLVVPIGKTDSLLLADGSVVYLNGGSTLWYPVEFQHNQRLVKLTGEGYFQVTGNRKKPFIVKTDPIDIKVLGTTFNVKAYGDDEVCEVLLESGHVRVENMFLEQGIDLFPDELLLYQIADNSYNKESVDPGSILSWRSGDYSFRSVPLAEICKTLERGFGVRFILEDPEIGRKILRASVSTGKNIYENLDNLKIIGDFNYSIKQKDTIVIHK